MTPNGVSFFSLLGLLFVGLKLGGIIAWSWWYVLAPFWGPPAVVLAAAAIIVLLKLAAGVAGAHRRSGRR